MMRTHSRLESSLTSRTLTRCLQASIYLVTSPRLTWLIGVFYGVLDSFSVIGVGVAMSDSFGRAHLAQLMAITRCTAACSVDVSLSITRR